MTELTHDELATDAIPDETGHAGVVEPVEREPDEPEDDPAELHTQPTED